MRLLFLTLLVAFMIAATPVWAADTQSAAPEAAQIQLDSQTDQPAASAAQQAPVSDYGSIKPVSPREFTDRVNKFVGEVNGMVAGIIVPLAILAMLISAAALALGSLIGWKAVQRFGWGGLFLSILGLLVYWGIPIIIGLTKSLAGYFAQ